jgi:hypothetical protein
MGWGKIESGKTSDVLLKAYVPFVKHDQRVRKKIFRFMKPSCVLEERKKTICELIGSFGLISMMTASLCRQVGAFGFSLG